MSGRPTGKIEINSSRCKGCGLCIEACPKKHISFDEKEDSRGIRVARFEKDHDCTGCKFCYTVCPDVAISVYKRRRKKL